MRAFPAAFWQPLSPAERAAEETFTREFEAFLSDDDKEWALAQFQQLKPPQPGRDAFVGDPVIRPLIFGTFHPRAADPSVWPRLRKYAGFLREVPYLMGIGPTLMRGGRRSRRRVSRLLGDRYLFSPHGEWLAVHTPIPCFDCAPLECRNDRSGSGSWRDPRATRTADICGV